MENVTLVQVVSIVLGVVGTFIGVATLLQKLYSTSIKEVKDLEKRLSLLEAKDKEVDRKLERLASPEKMAKITVHIECLQQSFDRLETQTNRQIEQLNENMGKLSASFTENFSKLNERLSNVLIENEKDRNNS